MRSAIVTGANGFVGSWLVKELVDNDVKVYAVVRNNSSNIKLIKSYKNVKIIYCDLKNILSLTEKIKERDFDVFYHLAWSGSSGKDRSNYEMQLLNSKYTCDAAIVAKKLNCKKFLCSGTITEKIAADILNIDVKAENIIYGLEKHNTHCLLDILCKKINLPYVWMQFSNIYGPYNYSGNIISYTLNELIQCKTPTFSKGDQYYDFVYIKDLVRAVYLLGEKNTSNNCYFIGSDSPRKLRDYLIKIKEIFGEGREIKLGARSEDGLKYYEEWIDISELNKDTGFESKYTFEEGIKETINWIKGDCDKL